MKQNQFKIAIGVGVAFLSVITMITLWTLSSNSQKINQQTSTSIFGYHGRSRVPNFFNGRNSRNSRSSFYDSRQQNNLENFSSDISVKYDVKHGSSGTLPGNPPVGNTAPPEEELGNSNPVKCVINSGPNGEYQAEISTEMKKRSGNRYSLRTIAKGKVEVKSTLAGRFNTTRTSKLLNLNCDTGWQDMGRIKDWKKHYGEKVKSNDVICYRKEDPDNDENKDPEGIVAGKISQVENSNQVKLTSLAGFGYFRTTTSPWFIPSPYSNYVFSEATVHCWKSSLLNK